MKKYIVAVMLIAFGILAVSSLVIAGVNPGTGIKSTSHDLSMATGKGATWAPNADPLLDRICIYCHAPHNTLTTATANAAGIHYFPLWNHNLSTVASYTMYSNGTELPGSIQHQLNAVLTQPGSTSKLCLSCHDGTIGISAYGFAGQTSSLGPTTGPKASGRILIGNNGDLSNHHPIGFAYAPVAILDDEIKDPSSLLLGNNPYNLAINDILWNGNVECTSCHDVHNTKNTGLKFLWVEDTNSNLCFSCHAK
ncbi:MAG: cytochrome c3 family protein [Dissulfurispiraceae bacterium]